MRATMATLMLEVDQLAHERHAAPYGAWVLVLRGAACRWHACMGAVPRPQVPAQLSPCL